MVSRRQRRLAVLLAALISSTTFPANACNIPVFRYALENWQPDSYQTFVVSRGALSDEQAAWVKAMKETAADPLRPANLRVATIDIDQQTVRELLQQDFPDLRLPTWAVEQLQQLFERTSADEPQMVVLYPGMWDRVAWYVPLTESHAAHLVDSPVRREVSDRLLDGQSAVWVFLESGDADQDAAAWERLQAQLSEANQVVELPDRELIETDDEYRADVEIDLRVEFSAVRISADDVAEEAFVAMLRGSESDLRGFDDPIAIPVYGRGRTHYALVGAGIQRDTVLQNGQFICGACSCQVKQENPGVDLLFAVDWADKVQGSAMPDIKLPELTGIGALELVAMPSSDVPADAPEPETPSSRDVAAEVAETDISEVTDDPDQVTSPISASTDSGRPQVDDDSHAPSTTVEASTGEPVANGPAVSDANSADAVRSQSFEKRLVRGVGTGIVVAAVLIAMATLWLRRAAG